MQVAHRIADDKIICPRAAGLLEDASNVLDHGFHLVYITVRNEQNDVVSVLSTPNWTL